jgi:hypothetical protein
MFSAINLEREFLLAKLELVIGLGEHQFELE